MDHLCVLNTESYTLYHGEIDLYQQKAAASIGNVQAGALQRFVTFGTAILRNRRSRQRRDRPTFRRITCTTTAYFSLGRRLGTMKMALYASTVPEKGSRPWTRQARIPSRTSAFAPPPTRSFAWLMPTLSYPVSPPHPPLPAYTSMTYAEPAVYGYRNADLRG